MHFKCTCVFNDGYYLILFVRLCVECFPLNVLVIFLAAWNQATSSPRPLCSKPQLAGENLIFEKLWKNVSDCEAQQHIKATFRKTHAVASFPLHSGLVSTAVGTYGLQFAACSNANVGPSKATWIQLASRLAEIGVPFRMHQ